MTSLPSTAREYIQWVFSPHVGVLCNEEVEAICLKNNLKFADLLQPFCALDDDGELLYMRAMLFSYLVYFV